MLEFVHCVFSMLVLFRFLLKMAEYLHKFRGLSELQEAKGGYINDLEAEIDTTIPISCQKFELELYQDSWDIKPHPNILYITPYGRSKKDRRQISLESYK